ncbi:MAG: phosphate/phosphite/phosphonate ABC transporter substrate-binding protein, partial [Rhodospirillales bacterium]|nr:phosphate/phosphite/phosphonate ABC transporter substrate-binding protein [Rhodospirillales bacterium]
DTTFGAEPAADIKSGASNDGFRFGVFPFLPPLSLDRAFSPIIANLSSGLGTRFHLRTKNRFEEFWQALSDGAYDFAFLHPFFYVEAADRYGYKPVVRLRDPLRAVVMEGSASRRNGLHDLMGGTLALPPKLAAISKIMEVELKDAGLRPGIDINLRYYQSKMSCLHAVAVGDADACAVPRFALSHLSSERLSELRILYETKPVSSVLIAAHPRVAEVDRNRLRDWIVAWPETEAGRDILAKTGWNGFVEAHDRDYDEIRHHESRSQQMTGQP